MSTYDQLTKNPSPSFVSGVQPDVASFAFGKGLESELEVMLCCARELFGSGVRTVLEEDAEIPSDLHVVFEVKTTGQVDDILRKEDEWHERSIELAPKALPFFRLLVDLQ